MKFRKKPVVVDAEQWTGENFAEILRFVPDGSLRIRDDRTLSIFTLEGEMLASPLDWIIKGTAGEFYPCKPAIFAEIYETAE